MKLTNRYGQNFLLNDNVVKKFIDSSLITSNDSVYEIGTGHGILTKNLCEKAKSVVSSEIDSDLYNLCTNIIIIIIDVNNQNDLIYSYIAK